MRGASTSGGQFATARRGIDPVTLRMAHDIVQRSGYQAAEAATGISKIDLQRHLLPPPAQRRGPVICLKEAVSQMVETTPAVKIHALVREAIVAARPQPTRREAKPIIHEVADQHGLFYADLIGPSRERHIAWPRQEAMWRIRQACPHISLPGIGRLLGGRDHTTILHGIRAHEKRMAEGVA